MNRDCLIVNAIWEARKEIYRTGRESDAQLIDVMNLAVQYGRRDKITFEEIDDALGQALYELICL